MKKSIQKITNILWGRIARNIYFLLFFIVPRLLGAETGAYTFQEIYIALLLLFIMLAPLYFNNLVLVPYLLARRKYILYFPASFLTILGSSTLYTFVLTTMMRQLPHLDPQRIMWIVLKEGNLPSFTLLSATHFVLFMILTFMFTICWYIMDYQKKQDELIEIKKKQTETELAFLKSQLNPHFLFNTLNNLYGLALKKADNTPDAILELSLILRYLLYESDTAFVSFEKEKGIMEAYIKLELLRLSNTDSFVYDISADKPYNVPPLLWLPILENLFKHGTRYISEEFKIKYSCVINNNRMHIHAENYFKPDVKHIEDTGGIGLDNLRKRLSLLYPGKHEITITETDNLYITDIQITLS